jgi:hypothetical protein
VKIGLSFVYIYRVKIKFSFALWSFSLPLTFSIGPMKARFLLPAKALFNLISHCRTVFSFSDEKGVHLMDHVAFVC